jgi:hypothetical protein
MAISVDTVYKTVLLILNKEQRGYMTPPEFNRIGTQVQLDIFEQYFEDLNQQLRVPQPNVDYADRQMALDEKIAPFKTTGTATLVTTIADNPYWNLPTQDLYGKAVVYNQLAPLATDEIAFYRLGTVTYKPVAPSVVLPTELQRLGRAEFYNLQKSDLTLASIYNPVYLYENNKLFVSPALADNTVTVDFLRKPLDIQWAFVAGIGQSYVFNNQAGQGSVNFELSSTEQTNVILKILLYAGIVIRDPQIVQVAAQQIQQEEINKKS